MTTSIDPVAPTAGTPSSTAKSQNDNGADRFLKLLVAQMKHQDPLNPLDNAEVTTQMAQISTVSGIEKLNKTIETMSAGFANLQALQGIAMVGREVTLPGNGLKVGTDGRARGGYLLEAAADRVTLEVYSGSGALLETVELGAADAGRRSFEYAPRSGVDPAQVASFRITAYQGTTASQPTTLMHDKVTAVHTAAQQLTLELARAGSTLYSSILAFH